MYLCMHVCINKRGYVQNPCMHVHIICLDPCNNFCYCIYSSCASPLWLSYGSPHSHWQRWRLWKRYRNWIPYCSIKTLIWSIPPRSIFPEFQERRVKRSARMRKEGFPSRSRSNRRCVGNRRDKRTIINPDDYVGGAKVWGDEGVTGMSSPPAAKGGRPSRTLLGMHVVSVLFFSLFFSPLFDSDFSHQRNQHLW